MAVQETEQKPTSGRQIFCPCHHIFNPLHQMWLFSRAAAPWALARGYNGQAPENCSCFLPLSSLNWPLKVFFQKLEPTVWLVKLRQIRGQGRNTLRISQKRLLLFLPDFTYLLLLHPKAVPNTEQTHSYTATGVNIASPFLMLRLQVERLRSPWKAQLCERPTTFKTKS